MAIKWSRDFWRPLPVDAVRTLIGRICDCAELAGGKREQTADVFSALNGSLGPLYRVRFDNNKSAELAFNYLIEAVICRAIPNAIAPNEDRGVRHCLMEAAAAHNRRTAQGLPADKVTLFKTAEAFAGYVGDYLNIPSTEEMQGTSQPLAQR